MEYVLETTELCKYYKKNKVLNNVNMHVPKGAIYGFVGQNGAGKTTLIRLITGLQKPSQGSYSIYGIDQKNKKICEARKRMGAVVETASIYVDLTAKENLRIQYKLLGLPDEFGIDELLDFVGLGDTGKKKVGHFSLGMKQRLGIAIALCNRPDFLVLDEPINGLDPQGIVEVREMILKINREMGITVLISSHILDELSKLATHYGFINKGEIVREIDAEHLTSECRKLSRVTCSDSSLLVKGLERQKLEYKVISEKEIDVYSEISVTKLVEIANEENCEITRIHDNDETLESFYMNLIGGGRNV